MSHGSPLTFDRFLRYDELSHDLHSLAAQFPELVALEQYGTSYEGRPLLLVTVTDSATGAHHTKPAHWIDANIHSTEVTGGAAALHVLHWLVTASERNDQTTLQALATRTFYVAPRVNPDGVEAALADSPTFRRSSLRPWPFADAHQWPGLVEQDIDGDGLIRTMRIADVNGAWIEHPEDPRVMIPLPLDGIVSTDIIRYRLLAEGTISDFDGFTVPTPSPPQSLDLNRNFPAGWATSVRGAGDHPLSEPEIDALVRAIVARPNICGYNAFHTSGGILLRPSSTAADSTLAPSDVWTWNELGKRATELTGYPVHSVFEDFTWDTSHTMSGASDDWAYEHLGVFSWTTEFWDVIHHATGTRSSTKIWYVGPTAEEELAVARWADAHASAPERAADLYSTWTPFDHPQLGAVEIGGADWFHLYGNAPESMLVDEVRPHAQFAVAQALASPRLEILRAEAVAIGEGLWRVEVGVANTGWLPTHVTARAAKENLVLPITVELRLPDSDSDVDAVSIVGGQNRVQAGQLSGRSSFRLDGGARSDGTPDRVLVSWVLRAQDRAALQGLAAIAIHQRAGAVERVVTVVE